MSLPDLPAYDLWVEVDDRSGKHADIKLAESLWGNDRGAHTDQTGLTTVWILPKSAMQSVTTGLVVLGALTSTSAMEPFGVVCSIDGRWNQPKQVLSGGTVAAFGNNAPYNSGSDTSVVQSDKCSNAAITNSALPINDGSWRQIIAEQAKLEALTPLVNRWMRPRRRWNKFTLTTVFANIFLAADIGLETDILTLGGERYWIQNHRDGDIDDGGRFASPASAVEQLLNTTAALGQSLQAFLCIGNWCPDPLPCQFI